MLEKSTSSDDPAVRLDTLIQVLQQVTFEQEAAFRALLQLSLETHATAGHNREATEEGLRGGRRIGWIEEALVPLGDSFDLPRLREESERMMRVPEHAHLRMMNGL